MCNDPDILLLTPVIQSLVWDELFVNEHHNLPLFDYLITVDQLFAVHACLSVFFNKHIFQEINKSRKYPISPSLLYCDLQSEVQKFVDL